ncbi:MAG: ArsR family transcriptional regulator [Actinobacteria bacterium ATB1]|nr:ArsR family transcriptional regulator [Actinobacteria bacterium ATB1]
MARAATTADVFNAVAERRRREILEYLDSGEATVGDIVDRLDIAQPQVSKHLRVLREVELVRSRSAGRHKLYRLNPEALRPVLEWTARFEQLWNERYDRLDAYLDDLQEEERE